MKTNGDSEEKRSTITFQSSHGTAYRAQPIRVTRYLAVFEIYLAGGGLRVSEVVQELKIVLDGRVVYSGKGTVKSLITTGMADVAEVSLEDAWLDVELAEAAVRPGIYGTEYDRFIRGSDKLFRVAADYKILVADLQTYLSHLRLWVDQVELGMKAAASAERMDRERQMLREVSPSVVSAMNAMFEKYEVLMEAIPGESRPMHRAYLQRHLHPLVMCSPFAHRTYTKPLGYAGDYEMVNMLIRDPFEGATLYARLLNSWFIAQPPAEAHRNRIAYLTQRLIDETVRVSAERRPARIFNLGCGPAGEVQEFLTGHFADHAQLLMLDFNDETLAYTNRILGEIKARHGRTTSIQFVKKSVIQIIKAASKAAVNGPDNTYDYLYCAGLFDYLPDQLCKQLINIFYDMLAPGGLLLVTNVDACNPIRHMLDDLLEWHLIYRNAADFRALAPGRVSSEGTRVFADYTGVNIFMEIRKPRP